MRDVESRKKATLTKPLLVILYGITSIFLIYDSINRLETTFISFLKKYIKRKFNPIDTYISSSIMTFKNNSSFPK